MKDDLGNLLNAVDNQSDEQYGREDTVASLIEVRRFLLPLMDLEKRKNEGKDKLVSAFIDAVKDLTERNPKFASRLELCNLNKAALHNLYQNIHNRGERMKEKIMDIVSNGQYVFSKASHEQCEG